MNVHELFQRRVSPEALTGCWLWTGGLNAHGYGRFQAPGDKERYAHRVAHELYRGPIPEGLDIDHLCRVRCCVNPAHLEAVTRGENVRRGIVGDVHRARYALITHCPHGHAYADGNVYFHVKKNCRMCRACARARAAKRRAEAKCSTS